MSAECLFFNYAMPSLRLCFASSVFYFERMARFNTQKSGNPSDFHPMNSPLAILLFLFYFLFPVAALLHQFSGSGQYPVWQFRIPAFLFLPAGTRYRQLSFLQGPAHTRHSVLSLLAACLPAVLCECLLRRFVQKDFFPVRL